MTAHVVGVLAEALAQHRVDLTWSRWLNNEGVEESGIEIIRCTCVCGDEMDLAEHERHQASVVAALPNIAIIEVPSVGYKAVGESDAQRYLNIACRVEDGYHVGGSNSRAAVAELLRRVSDSLAARAAGGQA